MKYNILELISELHSIAPQKVSSSKGGEFSSSCPGCGGKDRFHVWPAQNDGEGSYWCRGCGKGGDAIQFLRDFSGMSFKEASVKVGRGVELRTSVQRPILRKKTRVAWKPEIKERPSAVKDSKQWEEHALKFVRKCHHDLLGSSNHLKWLLNRGINKDYVSKWKLGLHATSGMKPSFRPRTSWGLSGGKNPKNGKPLMFVLPTGIVIPCLGMRGQVNRIRIRTAEHECPEPQKKYHAVVGSLMDTFVTRCNASTYVVVETELDAIMLDNVAGDLVGVVAVGSSHAKPTGDAGCAIIKAQRVINALDYDSAGSSAGVWWASNVTQTIRRPVPIGKDPGSFFEKAGEKIVREWVINGLSAAQRILVRKKEEKEYQSKELADTLGGRQGVCLEVHEPPSTVCHPMVLRLKVLLEQCPVAVRKTESFYGIVKLVGYSPKKHWCLFSDISQIIFEEPVMGYLHSLHDELITPGNIIRNRRC